MWYLVFKLETFIQRLQDKWYCKFSTCVPHNNLCIASYSSFRKGFKISRTNITVFSHIYYPKNTKPGSIIDISFMLNQRLLTNIFSKIYFVQPFLKITQTLKFQTFMTSLIYLCTEMSTTWTTSMQPQPLPVSFTYCHKRNFDTWAYQLVICYFITATHYL